MKRRGFKMTLAEVQAHQAKHGFAPPRPVKPEQADPKPKKLRGSAKEPNKTEAEFGVLLKAQRSRGEIIRYVYQGITLHWGGGMRYTPDWFVIVTQAPTYSFKAFRSRLIEIKGAKIWDRDIVRFKGCKAEWPEFEFEMWQRTEGRWNRLL
jgi:hypothetical protein